MILAEIKRRRLEIVETMLNHLQVEIKSLRTSPACKKRSTQCQAMNLGFMCREFPELASDSNSAGSGSWSTDKIMSSFASAARMSNEQNKCCAIGHRVHTGLLNFDNIRGLDLEQDDLKPDLPRWL